MRAVNYIEKSSGKSNCHLTTNFTNEFPDVLFWKHYEELWKNSVLKSPFQSPNLIKYLATRAGEVFWVYSAYQNNRLLGVGMFKLQNGVLRLLTDNRSDQNSFVISNHLSAKETDAFFTLFFQELSSRGWPLILHKIPSCTPYLSTLIRMSSENALFQLPCDYSVCPVLSAENGQELLQVFNRSKNLRYKINRFIRREEIKFEVLECNQDLTQWLQDFYLLHMKRWKNTNTRSKYNSRQSRIFQNQCMKAWLRDNVLVRFSILKGKKRVAMAMALRHKDGLIGNMQAFDPSYFKHSPGKTLLSFIAEWMYEKKMYTLNFGDGSDPYKYEFANNEQIINTIFISKKTKISFITKAYLLKIYRENQAVHSFCKTWIKPLFQKFEMKLNP